MPRPNVAGPSRHAADIGCRRERTPQDTRGRSPAPTASRVLASSGEPDSRGSTSSAGHPATQHPALSTAASSGVRRSRSPGLQDISPKRRRVNCQVERFLDLAAEDSKDDDEDDADDDGYTDFVDDQTVDEPQLPLPALTPRAWQRPDDTEDLHAVAAHFDERARKQRDGERARRQRDAAWRSADDPESRVPSGLVLREDRLVARTQTAVAAKQAAATYTPYSRILAFQRTDDSARQGSWIRLQRAPYGGRLALVLSTRVAGEHEYLVARLPDATEPSFIRDDADDFPSFLSEFPKTETEEAQRIADKKAARDTMDVCTTVVYSKPLSLHVFPPVLLTYEEIEPFLRSRHPELEHAAFVGVNSLSLQALADADRVVGQGRYRGSSGYIMSTWDATVSGRLVRVAKVRRHLALSRRVGQLLTQKGQTDGTEADVEGTEEDEMGAIVPVQEDEMGAIVPVSDLRRHALALPPVLQLLDRVRVVAGQSRGSTGRIEAIEDDWLTISTSISSEDSLVVNRRDINRDFRVGDLVEVVRGLYQGHKGLVIALGAAGILQIFVEEWSEGIDNWGSQLATVNSAATPESRHLAIHSANVNFLLLDDASACFGLEFFPVLSCARGIASRAPEDLLRRLVLEEREVEDRQWASMWAESGRRYEGIEVQVAFNGPHKGERGVVVGDHDTQERAARVAAAKAAGKGRYLAKQIDCLQEARGIIVTVRKEASNEQFDMKIERLLHIQVFVVLVLITHLCAPKRPTERHHLSTERPAGEMQFPAEVPGEKTGEWLTIPGIAQKRVDVQLQGLVALSQRNFRPSKTILGLEGRTGYLLLASPVLANTLQSTKVDVYAVGRNGTKHPIAPMCIRPLRVHDGTPITQIKGRVVVIGPDVVGDIEAVGRYGQTEPAVKHDFSPVAVVVRLENKGQSEGLRGVFPLSSLCLSVNVPIQAAHGNFPMTTFDEQP